MTENVLNPDKWVDRYADYLFNYTIVRVNDREVANDIISETFLAGLKSMKNFKGEARERTWLISILKRKIVDYYRRTNSIKGQAEIKVSLPDSENEGEWLEEKVADLTDRTAEDNMENEELRLAILECLAQLPEKQAEIFRKKTLEGMETEAICNEFNITPSNLWVIVHRARISLAKCLEKNWF